jgi:3-oxoacyl-[acyl-carrier protein] reductase
VFGFTLDEQGANLPRQYRPWTRRHQQAAAKAAMVAMTASLANVVAMDGVTVNAVSPGTIHSVSLDKAFREAAVKQGRAANAPWTEIEQTALPIFTQVPMGRVRTLEEIADAISFLVSPRASYITGANLRFNGGMWPGV